MSAAGVGGGRPGDPPRGEVRIDTGMTDRALDLTAAYTAVADATCGGIALFLGVVRDHHEGVDVAGLSYEAWEEEAPAALRRVAEEVAADHEAVRALYAWHRTGELDIGEPSVAVAASAPHRAEAFAACRDLIDRLKADVPIWKQEHLADGDHRWPGVDTP